MVCYVKDSLHPLCIVNWNHQTLKFLFTRYKIMSGNQTWSVTPSYL